MTPVAFKATWVLATLAASNHRMNRRSGASLAGCRRASSFFLGRGALHALSGKAFHIERHLKGEAFKKTGMKNVFSRRLILVAFEDAATAFYALNARGIWVALQR